MPLVKKTQFETDKYEVSSITSIEEATLLSKYLKENCDLGTRMPQGGGDFEFDLSMFVDEEAEDEGEAIDMTMPFEITLIANKIKKHFYSQHSINSEEDIPITYKMESWQ